METYFLLVVLIAAAGFFAAHRMRARRRQESLVVVVRAIEEYFANSAASVSARVITTDPGQLTALIESEPLKRFRYSHIVEASLIDHVRRRTGIGLERVYWRFPLAQRPPAGPKADDYIAEGLSRLKAKHDYTVGEGSWGEFEQALKSDSIPSGDPEQRG